jgi:hypothetical protein
MSVISVVGEALENKWFEVLDGSDTVYVRLFVTIDNFGREKISYFSAAFDEHHNPTIPLFYRGHDLEFFSRFNEVEDPKIIAQLTAFEAKQLLGGKG